MSAIADHAVIGGGGGDPPVRPHRPCRDGRRRLRRRGRRHPVRQRLRQPRAAGGAEHHRPEAARASTRRRSSCCTTPSATCSAPKACSRSASLRCGARYGDEALVGEVLAFIDAPSHRGLIRAGVRIQRVSARAGDRPDARDPGRWRSAAGAGGARRRGPPGAGVPDRAGGFRRSGGAGALAARGGADPRRRPRSLPALRAQGCRDLVMFGRCDGPRCSICGRTRRVRAFWPASAAPPSPAMTGCWLPW